jgi:CO/xanthine dehydrogenase Mo-binding subunit
MPRLPGDLEKYPLLDSWIRIDRQGRVTVLTGKAAEIDRASGWVRVRHVVAAADSGQAINPDGIRNQIAGGTVRSLSWSLHEAARFDHTRIESRDWNSYPILRFPEAPDGIEVEIADRPGQPFLGGGEAAQGPTAALANADATCRSAPSASRRRSV